MSPQQIRETLKTWIVRHGEPCTDSVFINELCVVDKSRRADLVHANGRLAGFEVKSAADSFVRWSGQMTAYRRVFDTVWLCCHGSHVEKALTLSHRDIGVLAVDDYQNIAVIRQARVNQDIDPYDLTGLLWREELQQLAAEAELSIPARMRLREARKIVAADLPLDAIRAKVNTSLKRRYGQSSPSSAA